jgi:hypothetical protein
VLLVTDTAPAVLVTSMPALLAPAVVADPLLRVTGAPADTRMPELFDPWVATLALVIATGPEVVLTWIAAAPFPAVETVPLPMVTPPAPVRARTPTAWAPKVLTFALVIETAPAPPEATTPLL